MVLEPVNTNCESGPVNTNLWPGPVNKNWEPGTVDKNLGPRLVNTNCGSGPRAKQKAGWEIQRTGSIWKCENHFNYLSFHAACGLFL